MKKAGDLLSIIFDDEILQKARGYHNLFSSWKIIAGERIAAHSRIVELERYVLLVEADHPGWVQILRTKQKELLNAVRRRFPDLSINGIAFRLCRDPEVFQRGDRQDDSEGKEPAAGGTLEVPSAEFSVEISGNPAREAESSLRGYDAITDEHFRETLQRLERSIALKEAALSKKKKPR
ncbi:MAG: DUF721 domain-containing protein [Spirochaetaceae bacterium]|jgi:hypothetical protein|nr:DUF721 domain-containing protein [Spirochaetaceae bacterium]